METELQRKDSSMEEMSKTVEDLAEQCNEKEQSLKLLKAKVDEVIQLKLRKKLFDLDVKLIMTFLG